MRRDDRRIHPKHRRERALRPPFAAARVMAVAPMWHGLAGSAKGATTPIGLMNIRPQCPVQDGFPLFCRDNADVLNLADACVLPDRGAYEAFLRPRGRSCWAGPTVIVFSAGGRRRWPSPDRSEGQGARPSRGKTPDDGDGIIQHCLAQIEVLCYSEMDRDRIRFCPRLSEEGIDKERNFLFGFAVTH
jgi:hypothetical protein